MADRSADPPGGTLEADPRRFLAALIESSDDAIIGTDARGIVRSWNPGAERLYGYRAEEMIGKSTSVLAPPELVDDVPALLTRLRRGEHIRHYETQRVCKDGRRVEVSLTVSPILDDGARLVGASTIARDITASKRAAAYDRLLLRAGKVLNMSLDPELAMRRLAELVVFTAADFCLTYLADEEGIRRVGLAHTDAEKRDVLRLLETLHPPAAASHPARAAVESGEMLLVADLSEEAVAEYSRSAEHLRLLRLLEPSSTVVLPLEVRGRRIGALAASTARGGKQPFREADLPRLQELARRAALSVDNSLLLRKARLGEERLHVALEAARMGTWEWDVAGMKVVWSEALQRIHGLEPGTFDGSLEAFRREIHPDDVDRVEARIRQALESGSEYHAEYRFFRPDGELRWLAANAMVVRDAKGNAIRMVGVCADITRRKKVEAADRFLGSASELLGSSLDYETTLRTVSDLAIPEVADWCAVYLVEGEEVRRVALSHPDPEERRVIEALSDRIAPSLNASMGVGAAIRTGRPEFLPEVTAEMLRAAGYGEEGIRLVERTGVSAAIAVPFEARDRRLGAIVFALSRSGRRFEEADVPLLSEIATRAGAAIENARLYEGERKAAAELERERARLERAVQSRDEVLAFVSHDIRNLLGLVETGARALIELPLEREQRREGLERVLGASRKALRLVDDLLDNARADAGGRELSTREVDPAEAVREAAEAFRDFADASGVELDLDLPDGLPAMRADPDQLLRVFANLLTNAIRHSPEGGRVEIGVDPGPSAVVFRVRDEGPGVRADERERIFDRFWQGTSSKGAVAGAGLGLAIAKGIVEAHGGTIRVESEEGRGSTFLFEVPTAAETAASY